MSEYEKLIKYFDGRLNNFEDNLKKSNILLNKAIIQQTNINSKLTYKLEEAISGHKTTQKVVGKIIDDLKLSKFILSGAEGRPGIIDQVTKQQEDINDLKKYKDKLITTSIVVHAVVVAFFGVLTLAVKMGWI